MAAPPVAYQLCPVDSYDEPWILWSDREERLAIRAAYQDLVCRSCGKVDELAALQRGISPDVTVRTRADVLGTGEDLGVIVSQRFHAMVAELGVGGLSFLPIPSSPAHYFAIADRLVETDLSMAGFEDHGSLCHRCHRFRERTVGPLIQSLAVPAERLTFFASSEWSESVRGKRQPIFVTPHLADVLRLRRFRGIDLVVAI
jgi:hypothetical protein